MFIWTISDAIGAAVWGVILLACLAGLALIGLDKLDRKFRAWRSR